MTRIVFFVWLFIVVIMVASNPAGQKKCSKQSNTCQSNSNNAPTNYQQVATQTYPYAQQDTVQNQMPNQPGVDVASQLLMNKIFANPGLQKILDPNTKLYNQNGQEIPRQPNTGSVPNIINNYFIVPPEFFLFNGTKTEAIPEKEPKRIKNNSTRNESKIKSKPKLDVAADIVDPIQNVEQNNRPKSRIKERKRSRNQQTTKIIANDDEADAGTNQNKANIEVNNKKRKRKQGSSNKNNTPIISTPPPSADCKEDFIDEVGVVCPVIENNKPKRRKPSRKESNDGKQIASDSPILSDAVEVVENDLLENKMISVPDDEKLPLRKKKADKTLNGVEPGKSSQLKNIESPVDNIEAINNKENRQTRNSKSDVIRKETRKKISPNPDDILKNFFPYLYTGNSYYPFNLEQFYGHYFNRSNKKPKRRKSKNNNKEKNKKGSQPKVVKVKIKQKTRTLTTTANPLPEESIEETYTTDLETTTEMTEPIINIPITISRETYTTDLETSTEMTEPITNIPMTIPRKEMVIPLKENEIESDIPESKFVATKASLEMPPTVIEDLQEYMIPELGREDIIPTVHSNGIIQDYYPVFHDDFHYFDDDSYYLKDLEDDRHFYSTDPGHEELLNRERRKYDRNEDYRAPNLDIKDRINFRRGYKYRDDRAKNFDGGGEYTIRKPYARERLTEQKHVPVKTTSIEEFNFQTPPLLKNPDFKTKKIEIESSTPDYSDENHAPIFKEYLVEKVSDKPEILYPNTKSLQFSKLENFDDNLKKDVSTNNKPKNDRIETVFAKTRVVKYGAAKDESEENASISMSHEDDSDKYYGDGTTYVIAKSLGYDDDIYW